MLEKYSAQSPSRRHPLTFRFAFSHPLHLWATFFGAGAMQPAPGTWGSLAGTLSYALMHQWLSWPWLLAMTIVGFFVGVWASDYVGKKVGIADHGGIVIDEVIAIWALNLCMPANWTHWLLGLVAFRFFDIIKLWPVSWLDQHMKNGWGVMIDDLLAALYAGIVLGVLGHVVPLLV